METQEHKTISLIHHKSVIILVSFAFLFLLYHTAEYMLLFKNSIIGFFIFQILFFVAAFLFGKWYSGNGLAAWGLIFSTRLFKPLIYGILLGVLMYAIPYFTSIALGIETIIKIPDVSTIIKTGLPFISGVLFSSFSEDILTRGLVYSFFKNRIKPLVLILLSALIYLLNHIYRLNDSFETLLYLYLLGIIFIIPVIQTKTLWITGGMHWAGNSFFFISHNIIQTNSNLNLLSPNYLFALFLVIFIPLIWVLTNYCSQYFKNNS